MIYIIMVGLFLAVLISFIEGEGVSLFVFLSLLILCLCICSFCSPLREFELTNSYEIYALEDTLTVHGSMFYIDGDLEYFYIAKYKDGKKMYSIKKNKAYIVELENCKPHIEVYKERIIGNKITKWFFKSALIKEYKIIVPKRTITTEFNIDMKD